MDDSLRDAFRQVRFLCDKEDVPAQFFIVTACNPDGVIVTDEENTRADETLRQMIKDNAFRVTGGNFDFSHSEPGWAICCSREQARALAAQFRQVAFFEVHDERVILLPTNASGGDGEDLGEWQERLDDGEPCCPFCFARMMKGACNHLLSAS